MKSNGTFKWAALFLLPSLSFATIVPEGLYAGIIGELSYMPSLDFIISPTGYANINNGLALQGFSPLSNSLGNIRSKIGAGGGVFMGYRFCGFRMEGELLFNATTYSQVNIDGYTFGGSQQVQSLPYVGPVITFPYTQSGSTDLGAAFLNVFYDFYDQSQGEAKWIPYVGVGIGYGYARNQYTINLNYLNGTGTGYAATTIYQFNENASTPVGQASIGVSYLFDERFSMALDYRYLVTKTVSVLDERLSFHTLNITVTHWFDC